MIKIGPSLHLLLGVAADHLHLPDSVQCLRLHSADVLVCVCEIYVVSICRIKLQILRAINVSDSFVQRLQT